jgi:NAD(P)-dependent dehydrogenase (short-subunit alcohol dehydrogenase family)
MARIFVSGSSTGLGLLAGKELLAKGHDVIFHARNAARTEGIERELADAPSIVIGDIGTVSGALDVADQVNALGPVDAVIHNAGVAGGLLRPTADGIPDIFAVNVLAPYILTARIGSPNRLIYLSSGMHRVLPDLDDVLWRSRRWNGSSAYSESKFFVTALAFAVARLRPEVRANAVDPGWVPTRMGGRGAPDDLGEGCATQVALATSSESRVAELTGQYLHHMAVRQPDKHTRVTALQDQLLDICQRLSGVRL